jgi:hypothetical protein
VGFCGKVELEFELNTTPKPNPDLESDCPRLATDSRDRFNSYQSFEASASLIFFTELSLELDFYVVRVSVAIRGEIDLAKYAYKTCTETRRSPFVSDDVDAVALPLSEERVITQIAWVTEGTTLGGVVKFVMTLRVEVDIEIYSFSKSWSWEVPFAEWKGYSIGGPNTGFTQKPDPRTIPRG